MQAIEKGSRHFTLFRIWNNNMSGFRTGSKDRMLLQTKSKHPFKSFLFRYYQWNLWEQAVLLAVSSLFSVLASFQHSSLLQADGCSRYICKRENNRLIICSEELKAGTQMDTWTSMFTAALFTNLKVETTQVFINTWIDKQNACTHNEYCCCLVTKLFPTLVQPHGL